MQINKSNSHTKFIDLNSNQKHLLQYHLKKKLNKANIMKITWIRTFINTDTFTSFNTFSHKHLTETHENTPTNIYEIICL